MSIKRAELAVCTIAQRYIYAFGGYCHTDDKFLDDIEMYDSKSDTWELMSIKMT